MIPNDIRFDYYEWLKGLVCAERFPITNSYEKLLSTLYSTEFYFLLSRDGNRADDGINMRYRFALFNGYEENADEIMDILAGPCSVLEMMIALAIRCEETIMDDPDIGDRTGTWFWGMVVNLGLGDMYDALYDGYLVDEVLERFLERDYAPDGKGGLFRVRNCNRDLRNVEIWIQLLWYLDSITDTDV